MLHKYHWDAAHFKCMYAGAQVKPEARTYYELSAATLKFVFPRPGFLEGIKGRSQAITKITNVRPASLGIVPS